MTRYVIVGGGVAGTTAAQNLRRLDPSAAVVLLGDEPTPYYYRPKLWEFLAGSIEQPALMYRPADWYAAQKIDLRISTTASAIQPNSRTLTLASGEVLSYDRLLLATGACCYVPGLPGVKLPGVFVLRTLQDAVAIRAQASRSRRAVVIGGGLLGLETAHALSVLKQEVTVIEIAPHLLPRQLDREGAQFLQARLESMGLKFITGARTAAVTGESAATGIRLEDGREVPGELILFSAGIVPNADLAREAGIDSNKGILVNPSMQTGMEGIFAAGDVAEFEGRVYGLVPPAIEQARVAAQTMAGVGQAGYSGTLPAATLKLVGMDLTSLGEATAEDAALIIRRAADEKAMCYKKLVIRNGVLVGAILLNETGTVPLFKQLMASKRDVSRVVDRLLDETFDLKGFLAEK
ncbi:MAG: NAD(P)/FAD-dependent oxidoreductase [Anaerolineales bacterium]|nr:NAD(P)/FAD-dependent oxidoreductase [Anaerolineales bacterium]